MSGADGGGGAGWLGRLRRGLGPSSATLADGIADLFTKRKLDSQGLEALESLVMPGDLGVAKGARRGPALDKAGYAAGGAAET